MSEEARKKSVEQAMERIRRGVTLPDARQVGDRILAGDRTSLAQAITWVESTNDDQQALGTAILKHCLKATGRSMRIGITGVPGVGKSTLIDALGMHAIEQGHRVAVLAIDPTSQLSKGSILGDQTRMERLSQHENAFIRPSASAETLGGVARRTRELMLLCEAAGYDVVIVETVGVGQSETAVHAMTDMFLLLMLAGAGDQLQGIKRGIMEMCDALVITKADSGNENAANRAMGEYQSALHMFPPKESSWVPQVLSCSALQHVGIEDVWALIEQHHRWMSERELLAAFRARQQQNWMDEYIKEELILRFWNDPEIMHRMTELRAQCMRGEITPYEAAEVLLAMGS
ncbi:MAG: methylmalonyl Co-A mutase-associated GTPase MeaB [Flavobacteriales bacterium]